jgi:hypothetical protein
MTSPPFRVETVPVRRTGRGPVVIAALAATLVAVSIVKPWSGADPGTADPSRDFASPAAVAVNPVVLAPAAPSPGDASPAPGHLAPAQGIAAAESASLAPGQIDCGSSGWDLVTLGSFLRWTVRTLTAITPVAAGGPGDPSIPVLSLGESDVAGLGACAPSTSPVAPGRASRIVEAWRRGAAGATTTTAATDTAGATMPGVAVPPDATAPSGAASSATDGGTGTAATWERLTLAQLDPLPSGGRAATRLTPTSVTELYRPVPASQHGRWPAGRYVLLLASPDAGADRWIAVDIGAGK